MKVLIAYGSRLGATEGIAERIGEVLRADGLTVSVQPAASAGPIADYDAAIGGGGIYAGHWHKSVKDFIDDNASVLSHMPAWLFSSGPVGERATHSVPTPWPGSSSARRSGSRSRPRSSRGFARAGDPRSKAAAAPSRDS